MTQSYLAQSHLVPSDTTIITDEDILTYVKMSFKMPDIVEQITMCRTIENAALEIGMTVEVNELQEAADKIRISHQLISAHKTLAWLERHRLSVDDFELIAYQHCLSSKLAKYLFEDKVEPYFFSNQLQFNKALIYEIILEDEDLALELYYSIRENETSFYNAAHQYVQNQELRRRCGYRGEVGRSDLEPEVSSAVFSAQANQLLKPIVTSKGVHLILVEEMIPTELDEKLRSQIMLNLFYEWTKQQANP